MENINTAVNADALEQTKATTDPQGESGTATEADAADGRQGDGQKQEKTFTQEELDAIVQRRIADEKRRAEQRGLTSLAEREQELAKRELMLTAKEKIIAKGFSPELLDALNISSPEALDNSLSVIESEINKMKNAPLVLRGAVPGQFASSHTVDTLDVGTRQAMGLL